MDIFVPSLSVQMRSTGFIQCPINAATVQL